MGNKIFISYKYWDTSVNQNFSLKLIPPPGSSTPTILGQYITPRSYVDRLETLLADNNHIYKGEKDGEDLSNFKKSTIESALRNKIFDSTITIVLVSPNMKDANLPENDQWIPWEISYSLRESPRNGRTKKANALIAVILPDTSGSYEYFDNNPNNNFSILSKNLANIKRPSQTYYYNNDSYIVKANWKDMELNFTKYIKQALNNQECLDNFNLCKQIP